MIRRAIPTVRLLLDLIVGDITPMQASLATVAGYLLVIAWMIGVDPNTHPNEWTPIELTRNLFERRGFVR